MAGFASIPRRRVIAKCAKSDNFRVGAFPVAGEPEIGAPGFGSVPCPIVIAKFAKRVNFRVGGLSVAGEPEIRDGRLCLDSP